jgi:plexin A
MSPIVDNYAEIDQTRYWHLVKPVDDCFPNRDMSGHKAIPEIFLTRLLSTKGTIQKFVDDFLSTILSVNETLPPAVKWLFDLLDEAALSNGITDPEVVQAWKSNSLPLRFWVNFIKNPDFILDIQKTPVLDSCLSVIAQTLMDACSTSDHRLGKDSPSNKLLFAKDIPAYKKMVNRFYQDIASLLPVTDQEMSATMQCLSLAHSGEFDMISALKELYVYAAKYWGHILEGLEMDPMCQRLHLAHKLEDISCTLNGEETSSC